MVATSDLVSEQFDLMQSIATQFVDQASALQASIEASIIALEVPIFTDPNITIPAPIEITKVISTSPDVPDLPEAPIIALSNIPTPAMIEIDTPVYTAPDEPSIYSLNTPSSNFTNAPGELSISQQTYTPLSSPVVPDKPVLSSILIPTLASSLTNG